MAVSCTIMSHLLILYYLTSGQQDNPFSTFKIGILTESYCFHKNCDIYLNDSCYDVALVLHTCTDVNDNDLEVKGTQDDLFKTLKICI